MIMIAMRKWNAVSGTIALFVVIAIVMTVSLAFFFLVNDANNRPNNGVTGPPSSIHVLGSNTSTLAVKAGLATAGQYVLDVSKGFPIRFFLEDRGFNNSIILPVGITVVVTIGNLTYNLERLSDVFSSRGLPTNTTTPALGTIAGATLVVNYSLHVSTNVPRGTYNINLICVSYPNSKQFQANPDANFEVALYIG